MDDEQQEENIVYEEENSDQTTVKIKKLKDELKKCKSEKQDFLDGWQRSKADYINLKKRSEEDITRIKSYANEDLILELLSILDSFEMAFKDKEAWNSAPENWRKGVEFIHNQFIRTLEDFSVKTIDPVNEKFDPNLYHSIENVDVDDEKQDGKIIEVMQKGYQLKDKMIRYASVKVGEFKS